MLHSIEDTLNKTCLLGLSYFDVAGKQLKQTILAGTVVAVDNEIGITVLLNQAETTEKSAKNKEAHFILPTNLSCWFTAPQGEFHTSTDGVKIINPDFLITWDIYQTKETKQTNSTNSSDQDGEQQWWQWQPRTQAPSIG